MSEKVKRRKFIADLLFAGGTLTAGAFVARYAMDGDDEAQPQLVKQTEKPECETDKDVECELKPNECGPDPARLPDEEPEKVQRPPRPKIVDRDPFNDPNKLAGNVAMPKGHEPNVAGGVSMPTEPITPPKRVR